MLLWFVEKKIGPMDIDVRSEKRASILRECGLFDVAGDARAVIRGDTPGPSGQRGTVVAFPGEDLSAEMQLTVGYFPEKQEWVKCAGGKYWCGKLRGEEIAPESLRREDGAPGFMVKLSDGNEWEIAKALYGGGDRRLTRKLTIGEDGRAGKGDVIERYAALDVAAHRFFTAWAAAIDENRDAEYVLDDLINLAVLGLQANYRIGIDEAINVLGLFNEDNVWTACQATIGWQTVIAMAASDAEAQKKTNEADTPSG